MRRRKERIGEWHHRAPDYKLVYCGPKESHKYDGTKNHSSHRLYEFPITDTFDDVEMDIELISKKKK